MGARFLRTGWLVPERLAAWQNPLVRELRARCPLDRDLIWILSSGTQSVNQVKAIGLDVAAIETSARSVNRFLQVTSADRWALALPDYHIGGYAILVRASLSRSRVFRLGQWAPESFTRFVDKNKITLASLVPAQIHDLVASKLRAPQALRAIVVGGGALLPDLYTRARALGWPLLPSYGLTECASQVATAPLRSLDRHVYPSLEVLPHVKIKTVEGRVWIRAESACRFVATMKPEGQFTLENPLRRGWLPTEDLGKVSRNRFTPLGRRDEVVKILGVLVSVPQVEMELSLLARDLEGSVAVLAVSTPRAGAELVAVIDSPDSLVLWERILITYNQAAQGPARVSKLCWVPELPRTSLGKLKRQELRQGLHIG
jgi:O-succinylbenzoic acid--CoA ligase